MTSCTPSVIVTGGAGFIGSHLCQAALGRGFRVTCVDNFLTGASENVAHLLNDPCFTVVRQDVTEPLAVDGPVDTVLHFASPASPRDYLRLPVETLRTGAFGVYRALELARERRATLLLASSSEIYGDPEVNPQPETYRGNVNSIGPRSVYDEAKRFSEAMACAYYRQHGVDVRIARIFNVYGPRMRISDGRVLPNFITQALKNEQLTVYGTGHQTRSFCYVDDLVSGVMLMMTAKPSYERPLVLNIGSSEEITILRCAREVIRATGSSSGITFRPLPEDDPRVRHPDLTLMRETLGWTPRISLREGLERVVPYFREALGQESLRPAHMSGAIPARVERAATEC